MKKIESAISRTQTAFSLSNELLKRLKIEARENDNLETINLDNLEGFIESL